MGGAPLQLPRVEEFVANPEGAAAAFMEVNPGEDGWFFWSVLTSLIVSSFCWKNGHRSSRPGCQQADVPMNCTRTMEPNLHNLCLTRAHLPALWTGK